MVGPKKAAGTRPTDGENSRRERHVNILVFTAKIIYILTGIRLLLPSAMDDLLEIEPTIGYPTWELSLAAVLTCAIVLVTRSREDQEVLGTNRHLLGCILAFYLPFTTGGAALGGMVTLWPGVAASVLGLLTIWLLSRRERALVR
ncbi:MULTISPECIES: hypothetical protein [Streptomyces]|uniref:Uncharacterized protein n=1 Tax=Streptomyces koyangensis TaxID=188770 RepID=A0ABX7EHB9_9ACTN|nr:hypothetical protein [Streptomyces koyangensis]QRF03105.1 hypothetical protein G9U55_13405 [Streptomyces koyangensis]